MVRAPLWRRDFSIQTCKALVPELTVVYNNLQRHVNRTTHCHFCMFSNGTSFSCVFFFSSLSKKGFINFIDGKRIFGTRQRFILQSFQIALSRENFALNAPRLGATASCCRERLCFRTSAQLALVGKCGNMCQPTLA